MTDLADCRRSWVIVMQKCNGADEKKSENRHTNDYPLPNTGFCGRTNAHYDFPYRTPTQLISPTGAHNAPLKTYNSADLKCPAFTLGAGGIVHLPNRPAGKVRQMKISRGISMPAK